MKNAADLIRNYQNRKGSDFNKALGSSICCEYHFLNIFSFYIQETILKVFKRAKIDTYIILFHNDTLIRIIMCGLLSPSSSLAPPTRGLSGPAERSKIWLGHQYMVNIIFPPPRPIWNRLKVAANR